jgi:hypothetical protein
MSMRGVGVTLCIAGSRTLRRPTFPEKRHWHGNGVMITLPNRALHGIGDGADQDA